jgi:hypothetical protein
LPTRIFNALSNAGLRTLGEVRESSDAILRSFQDLGSGSVRAAGTAVTTDGALLGLGVPEGEDNAVTPRTLAAEQRRNRDHVKIQEHETSEARPAAGLLLKLL